MKKIIMLLLVFCIMIVPVTYADDAAEGENEEEYIEEAPFDDTEDLEETTDDEEEETLDVETEYEEGYKSDVSTEMISVPDGITVILDGKIVIFDAAQPALINNRTMVPMRKMFEALGADVIWDNSTQTAKAVKGDMTVEITIGSNVMYSSGIPVEIDSPALLMRSRTYVPVRFISNALGAEVEWDNAKQIVYLSTK